MMNDNVQIKCYVANCLNVFQYEVSIYDSNKNLICKGNTNKFGIFNFTPIRNQIYHIVIETSLYPYKICKNYYFNGVCKTIPFVFFTNIPKIHSFVTFKLTDKNYTNLPIEKGEVKIWNI